MEFLEMDRIFKSLLKKGFMTDAEFQKVLQIENIDDRKSEVFDIMMVKDQTIAVEILNIFRRMTARVRAIKEDNGIHPLLNAVVADCIFGFLPMKDVLYCRLVCHQWRTASSVTLRKRVTIKFKTQGPYKFFEDFTNCIPENKFQAFKFSCNKDGWNTTEIEEFFEKCGANIKSLKFSPYRLFKDDEEFVLENYDISPLILKACNLINLDTTGCVVTKSGYHNKEHTLLEIQWSEMPPVKSISVHGCLISIHDVSQNNVKIKPLKIDLKDVAIKIGGTIQEKFLVNDVIDFSQATNLNLHTGGSTRTDTIMEFDMKSQVLNSQSVQFIDVQPKNWAAATGKVCFFYLRGADFKEKNNLQIQLLYCEKSRVNFSALPITIEKLSLSESRAFASGENINLPCLKYLRFNNNHNFQDIANLAECPNLVELELGECYPHPQRNFNVLNINWIPKSVKRMKIYFDNVHSFTNHYNEEGENAGHKIEDRSIIFHLDTLILVDYLHCLSSDVSEMMSIIKPKVLVVSGWNHRVIDTTSICEFVSANRQLKKVIVGSTDNLHKKTPFELSVFSGFVGNKRANYYQFENHSEKEGKHEDPIGTPISEEELDLYTKMDELDQRFYLGK